MATPLESPFEKLLVKLVKDGEDCQIDLFTRMSGLHWRDLLEHVRHFETQGVRLPYLDPEGLIRLKQGSPREKDLLDVHALRQILDGR